MIFLLQSVVVIATNEFRSLNPAYDAGYHFGMLYNWQRENIIAIISVITIILKY